MRTGTYYLNNNGSRWVNLTDGKRDCITLTTVTGRPIKDRSITGSLSGILQLLISVTKGSGLMYSLTLYWRINTMIILTICIVLISLASYNIVQDCRALDGLV